MDTTTVADTTMALSWVSVAAPCFLSLSARAFLRSSHNMTRACCPPQDVAREYDKGARQVPYIDESKYLPLVKGSDKHTKYCNRVAKELNSAAAAGSSRLIITPEYVMNTLISNMWYDGHQVVGRVRCIFDKDPRAGPLVFTLCVSPCAFHLVRVLLPGRSTTR